MHEEFDEEYQLKNKINFSIWKKVFKQLTEFKKTLIAFLIAITLVALCETYMNYLFAKAIERHLPVDGMPTKDGLAYTLMLIMMIVIASSILVFAFLRFSGMLEMKFYSKITRRIFHHLQELPFSFYDRNSVGWLVARVTSDTDRLGRVVSWGLIDAVWAISKLVFVIVLLLIVNPGLALIVVIFAPLLLIIGTLFRKVLIVEYRKSRRINSKITGELNEGISGAVTTKSLVVEDNYRKEFVTLTEKYRRVAKRSALMTTLYYQSIAFLTGIAIALTAFIGGRMVMDWKTGLTFSMLYLFIESMRSFFDPVLSFAHISNEIKHAQVAAERIFNILELDPDISDSAEVIKKYGTATNQHRDNWEELVGHIQFCHVDFSYNKEEQILQDFNLEVFPGESVAIVGETGAGKSTLVNLLCRFYKVTGGQILIDGRPLEERSSAWLHANLGYVQQTPHLFSGTIIDNIRYGKLDANEEEVRRVCQLVGADKFIEAFEKGYYSEVGEGGNKLSQGQKQLISFARALIGNPRLVILDEATSSVDTKTEFDLQQAIDAVLNNSTSFLIAHRLSTIVNVSKIIVMKKGKIIELGTHQQLMEQKGYYYNLFIKQYIDEQMHELKF